MIGLESFGPFAVPPPPRPRAGALLVAHPSLVDANFRESVVLLLNHSDEGSLGLVLNRPLVSDVGDVLPAWHEHVSEPSHLFQGGPVGLDSAIGLARLPGDDSEPPGLKRLTGSLAVVDLDAPPEIVAPASAGLRVYAGHSGWGPGQLEGELDEGAWFVVDGEPSDGFRADTDSLWRDVLLRQRTTVALVATFRADPEVN